MYIEILDILRLVYGHKLDKIKIDIRFSKTSFI